MLYTFIINLIIKLFIINLNSKQGLIFFYAPKRISLAFLKGTTSRPVHFNKTANNKSPHHL